MSDSVIISLIDAFTSLLIVFGIFWLNHNVSATRNELTNIHIQMNSRLDQLLKSEKAASRREGAKEEREKNA